MSLNPLKAFVVAAGLIGGTAAGQANELSITVPADDAASIDNYSVAICGLAYAGDEEPSPPMQQTLSDFCADAIESSIEKEYQSFVCDAAFSEGIASIEEKINDEGWTHEQISAAELENFLTFNDCLGRAHDDHLESIQKAFQNRFPDGLKMTITAP